tara:strand:- start:1273 stop:1659 length:387 start_codon:yes stop_codon:yes gene_type:complete
VTATQDQRFPLELDRREAFQTRGHPEPIVERANPMGIRWTLRPDQHRTELERISGAERVPGSVGVAAGLLGAFWLSRFVDAYLFRGKRWDPTTYVSVALGLLILSTLAAYVPARRAGRVSPVDVLRQE